MYSSKVQFSRFQTRTNLGRDSSIEKLILTDNLKPKQIGEISKYIRALDKRLSVPKLKVDEQSPVKSKKMKAYAKMNETLDAKLNRTSGTFFNKNRANILINQA